MTSLNWRFVCKISADFALNEIAFLPKYFNCRRDQVKRQNADRNIQSNQSCPTPRSKNFVKFNKNLMHTNFLSQLYLHLPCTYAVIVNRPKKLDNLKNLYAC